MATQQSRFIDDGVPRRRAAHDLVVRAQPGRPLNKKQQTFNKLVGTVDRLRASLDRDKARLDEALVFHAQQVQPRIERLVALRKDLIRQLRPFQGDRRLKHRDRREVGAILAEQLDDVLQNGGVLEADLRQLFERLHGASLAALEQAEIEEARSTMEAMFAELGVDLDLSDLRPDMSDADLAAKTAELIDSVRRQAEHAESEPGPEGSRATSQRRAQERARRSDELRKTSLGGIYRRLVKVLHPDLERDADIRRQKSALMQELTAAYAAGDLHTLLRLELEWLHREEAGGTRLAGETLEAYNRLLKEQVAELQMARDQLPFHPRYAPLVEEVGPFGGDVRVRLDGPAQVSRLDGIIEVLSSSVTLFESGDGLTEVREVIALRRRAMPFQD